MKKEMKIDDWIHVIAGIMVLVSLSLGIWVHPAWFILTALAGLNLLIYGTTGFCPMGIILKKLGVKQ